MDDAGWGDDDDAAVGGGDDDWGVGSNDNDGDDDDWGGGGGGGSDSNNNDDWGGGGDGDDDEGGEDLPLELQIENAFYEADDMRIDDPQEALMHFERVITLGRAASSTDMKEEVLGFVFKALRAVVSIHIHAKRRDDILVSFRALLDFVPHVTRNEGQEAVLAVLAEVSEWTDIDGWVRPMYELTFTVLNTMPEQERLRFRVRMKYAELCYARGMIDDAVGQLRVLLQSCQTADGDDDMSKGSELLEVYAMQTQISMKSHDHVALKALYAKTHLLTAAVKDPKSHSIIRECWGKMFGDQGEWSQAYLEFYNAFNSYSEIGNRERAKQCLKYVVVTNMLCGGTHNPFDAREAKVYQSDTDINAVEQLRIAHESMDVAQFNSALRELSKDRDDFILRHVGGIVRDFQCKAIEGIIRPYSRVRISFLGKELNIDDGAVEVLLVQLILDGRVVGRIDEAHGLLDMRETGTGGGAKYRALEQWTNNLSKAHQALTFPLLPTGGGGGYSLHDDLPPLEMMY